MHVKIKQKCLKCTKKCGNINENSNIDDRKKEKYNKYKVKRLTKATSENKSRKRGKEDVTQCYHYVIDVCCDSCALAEKCQQTWCYFYGSSDYCCFINGVFVERH